MKLCDIHIIAYFNGFVNPKNKKSVCNLRPHTRKMLDLDLLPHKINVIHPEMEKLKSALLPMVKCPLLDVS